MTISTSVVLLGACALAASASDATKVSMHLLATIRLLTWQLQRGSEVEWSSCSDLNPLYSFADATNITCGFYEVPLDYADELAGTAKLALAKDPAPEERWGTMFVNPGISLRPNSHTQLLMSFKAAQASLVSASSS